MEDIMTRQNFHQLFVDELQDMYSAENQIIAALPHMIKSAFHSDLKEALSHHLKETKHQITRLEKVFSLLELPCESKHCKGMEGILKEGKELVGHKAPSSIVDAAIISAAQKVEHYEIASYGTLCSFAKHLHLPSEVTSLLNENLDEEGSANKKLTKLADGTFFSSGINKEAVENPQHGKAH
jgi:ferritin-like metal-binding protein YciE